MIIKCYEALDPYLNTLDIGKFSWPKRTSDGRYLALRGPFQGGLEAEIVMAMMASPREFRLRTPVPEQLRRHVLTRVQVIRFASAARFGFGNKIPSHRDTVRDPFVHPDDWALGCNLSTHAVLWRALLEVFGDEDYNRQVTQHPESLVSEQFTSFAHDWIPGDWGYLRNVGHVDRKSEEGQNVIYLGQGRWWGHTTEGSRIMDLGAWRNYVLAWNEQPPQLKPWRRVLGIGFEHAVPS